MKWEKSQSELGIWQVFQGMLKQEAFESRVGYLHSQGDDGLQHLVAQAEGTTRWPRVWQDSQIPLKEVKPSWAKRCCKQSEHLPIVFKALHVLSKQLQSSSVAVLLSFSWGRIAESALWLQLQDWLGERFHSGYRADTGFGFTSQKGAEIHL